MCPVRPENEGSWLQTQAQGYVKDEEEQSLIVKLTNGRSCETNI